MSTAFKIGSVYRDAAGRPTKVVGAFFGEWREDGSAWVQSFYDGQWFGEGCRRLDDGTDPSEFLLDGKTPRTLLPGELELKDGQWVPVARGVEEPKRPLTLGDLLKQVLDRGISQPVHTKPTQQPYAAPKEKLRPRLTWADTKPVDRFEGYSVYSESNEVLHSHSHPTQKMQEGRNPGNGSAALLKVR